MLYYPQLSTRSVAQYPVQRLTELRSLVNVMPGGDSIRASDPGAGAIRWRLQYTSLTDAEWSAIEQLFAAVEGQLGSFTFLDPTSNLLAWSEDWTRKCWSADPLLALSPGAPDPFGGTNAMQITNSAQTSQRVMQETAGPGSFSYVFSVFVRSDAACEVDLVVSSAGQERAGAVAVGSTWKRAQFSADLGVTTDGVSFGIELPAGVRVGAFGAQAEGQPVAGQYMKTTDLAGVFANTRFDSDTLRRTVDAPNQNSTSLSLISKLI